MTAPTSQGGVEPGPLGGVEQGIDDIDILKIDIEGAELVFLESLSKVDFAHIRSLVIDIHDKYVETDRVHALLRSSGMRAENSMMGTWFYVRGVL